MRTPPTTPPIEVRDLRRAFGPTVALDGLGFTVAAGKVTGFLGPNGAGKTTAIRIMLGLDRPDSGEARVFGVPFRELGEPARRVGAVLDGAGFHPGRTAREHLRVLAGAAHLPERRVADVLEAVDLTGAADRRAGGFSLGMRRRLALASALLGEPELLVLDEPANGLDPAGIRWLRDALRQFAAAGGTVLVSSHVLAEVAQTADEVVVINRGRVVSQTDVATLTGEPAVLVRSPDRERLAAVLRAAGATAHAAGDDGIEVVGVGQEDVGRLAAGAGLVLFELTRRTHTLEEVFFDLTAEDESDVAG